VTGSGGAGPPRIRAQLDDFVVEEVPLYSPLGHGEHVFVEVEKRDRSTEDVARDLARIAGVRPAEVGYAGRKDRRAVARQWFSVAGAVPDQLLTAAPAGVRILRADRHPHKLRVGQLRGNRFSIWVRGVPAEMRAGLGPRLERITRAGMPNRFGRQRYGRDGRNAERGRDLLLGGRPPRDRRHARFLLSALQAAVFDEVLAARETPLDEIELGDVAQVCASGGLFVVESLEREQPRARRFEISATGPIFGTRMVAPQALPAQREGAVLARWGLETLADARVRRLPRLRGTRRPLRARPMEVAVEVESDAVRFCFALPAGTYATVFLEAALGVAPVETPGTSAPLPDAAPMSALP